MRSVRWVLPAVVACSAPPAPSQDPAPTVAAPATDAPEGRLAVIFSSRVEGEIEPCG